MYNRFLLDDIMQSQIYQMAAGSREQFIQNEELNISLVMEKFLEYYMELYQDADNAFRENEGCKIFLLYIKAVINGTGNFYIEACTRTSRRTDVIIEYHGRQYVIAIKNWNLQYAYAGMKSCSDNIMIECDETVI